MQYAKILVVAWQPFPTAFRANFHTFIKVVRKNRLEAKVGVVRVCFTVQGRIGLIVNYVPSWI
jgi:hypothetical protein